MPCAFLEVIWTPGTPSGPSLNRGIFNLPTSTAGRGMPWKTSPFFPRLEPSNLGDTLPSKVISSIRSNGEPSPWTLWNGGPCNPSFRSGTPLVKVYTALDHGKGAFPGPARGGDPMYSAPDFDGHNSKASPCFLGGWHGPLEMAPSCEARPRILSLPGHPSEGAGDVSRLARTSTSVAGGWIINGCLLSRLGNPAGSGRACFTAATDGRHLACCDGPRG